jgi:mono/diheme cytochrome c family protein
MGKSLIQIAGAFWNHTPQMAEIMGQRGVAWPSLTPEETTDFIAYLYYSNYYSEPGSAVAGRRLFSEKGCMDCHSIKGNGGLTGPPLDDYRRYSSALFVAQAMWNHGPQMIEAMQASRIERPYLREREAADLLAFVRGQTPDEIPDDKFMLPGSPGTGRRLFGEKGCTGCHSADGRSGTGASDQLNISAYKSVTEIAGAMWNHGPDIWAQMQRAGVARPTFAGTEMADIVSYLYFLRYSDKAGDPAAGKQLYTDKGCARCHSPVHSLGASDALNSPINLMAAMWNHAPVMEKLIQEEGLDWPIFQGDEMRDLIEYVKSSVRPKKRAKNRNGQD